MKDNTTITPLHRPEAILDPLNEIAREGARQKLAAALGAKAASFVPSFTDERLADGRQLVAHQGTGPARMIQTGIGPVPVQRRKVRDRAVLYHQTGQRARARREFERLHAADPGFEDVANRLGIGT